LLVERLDGVDRVVEPEAEAARLSELEARPAAVLPRQQLCQVATLIFVVFSWTRTVKWAFLGSLYVSSW